MMIPPKLIMKEILATAHLVCTDKHLSGNTEFGLTPNKKLMLCPGNKMSHLEGFAQFQTILAQCWATSHFQVNLDLTFWIFTLLSAQHLQDMYITFFKFSP